MAVDKEMEKNIIKMIRVKKYTHEPQILAALERVATTQEELQELLEKDVSPIYLCGDTFTIPEYKQYLQIIKINEPVIEYVEDVSYENIFIFPYQPSPLQKSFTEALAGSGKEELYSVLLSNIYGFKFNERQSTNELYETIMNSELPILR